MGSAGPSPPAASPTDATDWATTLGLSTCQRRRLVKGFLWAGLVPDNTPQQNPNRFGKRMLPAGPGTSRDVPNGLPSMRARGGPPRRVPPPSHTVHTVWPEGSATNGDPHLHVSRFDLCCGPRRFHPRPLVNEGVGGAISLPPLSAKTSYQDREDNHEGYPSMLQ